MTKIPELKLLHDEERGTHYGIMLGDMSVDEWKENPVVLLNGHEYRLEFSEVCE